MYFCFLAQNGVGRNNSVIISIASGLVEISDQILETQSSADCATNLIQKIPDDCMIEIFQMLPFTDKLNLERVCQHWKMLARNLEIGFWVVNKL